MFRRKEEGLFDNELNETNEAAESATVVGSSATSSASTASTSTAASVPVNSPISQPITRPTSSVPPAVASVAAASGFRTSNAYSSPSSSTSNTRTVEAKPLSAFSPQTSSKTGNRILTVGHDILLKGEINSCDRLVIEGKLEATLSDVHTLELAQIGSFKGAAQVAEAEISGNFEGDLVVSGRLVIYASGRVSGRISYGEIEIERGGELAGEIKTLGSAQASTKPARQKEAA